MDYELIQKLVLYALVGWRIIEAFYYDVIKKDTQKSTHSIAWAVLLYVMAVN